MIAASDDSDSEGEDDSDDDDSESEDEETPKKVMKWYGRNLRLCDIIFTYFN